MDLFPLSPAEADECSSGSTAFRSTIYASLSIVPEGPEQPRKLVPNADDLLAKAELTARITAEIQRRRMTQARAAAILGIDQPKISALKQGKLAGSSIERLMRLLLLLGRDVEISVRNKPKSRSAARLRVL